MQNKILAKNIYIKLRSLKNSGNSDDLGSNLFEVVINMMGSKDIESVYKEYQNILSGKLKIVEVISATELSETQRSELEKKVIEKSKSTELVFDYSMDLKIKGGILIKIGNEMIDMSMKSSIENLN